MSKRFLGVMLSCAVLVGMPVAPVEGKKLSKAPKWGGTDSPLRPGASLGGCTFNFVFYTPATAKAPAKGYIGTAGHCTDKVGEVVENPDIGPVGKVVYDSDVASPPSGVDFSLIQLDRKVIGQTNPEVLVWGGPTGFVTTEDFAVGDQIDVYGYGVGVGANEQTRPRSGALVSWTDNEYQADMPAVNGDSGAPLIHHETGAALGIISRYGIGVQVPSTDQGPLMTWILEELEKSGFNVRLATVK